MKRKNIGQQLE